MLKQRKRDPSKKASGKSAYDEALDFLTPRARTVREMQDHLDECDHSEAEVDAAVGRLLDNGLLSDEKFCEEFVRSRLSTKPVSRRRLREQLEGHKADEAAIEAALAAVTDEAELENARAVAEKFNRQFEGLPIEERMKRIASRLAGRGYSYEDIKTVLEELDDE